MPIRPTRRWLYPLDWPQLSVAIRFGRARGRCEACGRPHGLEIEVLADGSWRDPETRDWHDRRGRRTRGTPPGPTRMTRTVLACAHLNHDPSDNRARNLRALCGRCHLEHDREEHLRVRRITYLLRRALGDLFEGPYRV